MEKVSVNKLALMLNAVDMGIVASHVYLVDTNVTSNYSNSWRKKRKLDKISANTTKAVNNNELAVAK